MSNGIVDFGVEIGSLMVYILYIGLSRKAAQKYMSLENHAPVCSPPKPHPFLQLDVLCFFVPPTHNWIDTFVLKPFLLRIRRMFCQGISN